MLCRLILIKTPLASLSKICLPTAGLVKSTTPVIFDKSKVSIILSRKLPMVLLWRWCAKRTFFTQRKSRCHRKPKQTGDGGVASPTPFYWSTNGYGFMWHHLQNKGTYDWIKRKKHINTFARHRLPGCILYGR